MSDSLLPHNATAQERALEAVIAPPLMPPVPLREIWDPETCPANLLPWLAYAFSVDDWNPAWPEAAKREVIRQSFQIHRRKGTVGAMRRALESVFDQAQLQEWFETGGAPHTFSVSMSGPTDIAAAKAIINRTKPVRSHMSVIQVQSDQVCTLHVESAIAVRISQTIDAVLGQVDQMRRTAEIGFPLPLIAGTGKVLGVWVLTRVGEGQRIFAEQGAPLRQDFSISMRRYDGGLRSLLPF